MLFVLFKYTNMNKLQALKILEEMTDIDFQAFFKALPPRVQFTVKTGIVDWREVLPDWYIKQF